MVCDNTTMYYLMSGGNPKYRNSGATSLLLWNTIQDASKTNLKFDFEGSIIENQSITYYRRKYFLSR